MSKQDEIVRGIILTILIIMGITGISSESISAKEYKDNKIETAIKSNSSDESYYINSLLDELELDNIDTGTKKFDFEDMVKNIIDNGLNSKTTESIIKYFKDCLFFEISSEKDVCKSIFLVSIIFSIMNRLLLVKQQYMSEISFLMVYTTLMIMLLNNFSIIGDAVTDGLEKILCFFGTAIPAFSAALFISGNKMSAGFFYEFCYGLMFAMEWGMKMILIPGIHLYVLLQFLDNVFVEERLSKIAGLLKDVINFVLKTSIGVVLGIGVIQSLIIPAKDRLSGNIILKSVASIPGFGNLAGASGEILLSCGMLIKNSVGATMLIFLVIIAFVPMIKVIVCKWLYQFMAGILQPVSDRRIVNAVYSVAVGAELYIKVLINGVVLFFLMLSMVCTSTSFVY